MKQRLQKILSSRGVASRRKAEEMITAGRVTCNGIVARLGDSADPELDEILLDGRPLPSAEAFVYILLNKPRGYVTTLSDEKGRPNAAQLDADSGIRVYPVGRLDMDSEGLLLMTDDGELTQSLLHPSFEVEKEYLVWVTGDVDRALPILTAPMELDGDLLSPAKVQKGRSSGEITQLSVVIHQGKNRQVRRMCDKAGLSVQRLKRIREGKLELDRTLKPGQWRELNMQELQLLKEHQ